jgi:hypothetical protein
MWPTNKKHWMLTRHTRLTKAQEANLPVICEKWKRIALSTEPSNRHKAKEAVNRLYKALGASKPPRIVWLTSPLEFTEELHRSDASDPDKEVFVHHSLKLRGRDFSYLGATRFYNERVVNEVQSVIGRSVPALEAPIRVERIWGPITYGAAYARQFALADFFQTKRHRAEVYPFLDVALHCGYFIPYDKMVVFLERPKIINVDEQNRLHSFDGPSLAYRDGSYLSNFHGIAVNEKWITTPADQIDFADIMQEENAAVRGALLTKYGFDRLVQNVPHKTISKMKGNSLIEFVFPGRKYESQERPGIATLRLRALHLSWKDKTGAKETILPVPRTLREFGDDRPTNIHSCEQVRRWTLGWPKEALAMAET